MKPLWRIEVYDKDDNVIYSHYSGASLVRIACSIAFNELRRRPDATHGKVFDDRNHGREVCRFGKQLDLSL